MKKRLEDFVNENRDAFDKFEPGPVVWHNIQQSLKKPAPKKGILITMQTLRWSAAAAIVLALGVGAWWMASQNKKNPVDLAGAPTVQPAVDSPSQKNNPASGTTGTTQIEPSVTRLEKPSTPALEPDEADAREEMLHYARLVELKQNQIRKIQKDEPLLYQQFAGDVNKLDSTFHILKKELPLNPNREQILEAMIQNLQLQEALLNQQLNIIKKINNTKKEAYEKAYRSA